MKQAAIRAIRALGAMALVMVAAVSYVELSFLGFPDGYHPPADAILEVLHSLVGTAALIVAAGLLGLAVAGRVGGDRDPVAREIWAEITRVWWILAAVVTVVAWSGPALVREMWPATGA